MTGPTPSVTATVSLPAARQARERLLSLTVHKAVELSRYYREVLGTGTEVSSLADISRLPTLHKSTLVERLDDLRTFQRFPDFLMYTSGTTGRPLEVPVYREEIEANERLIIDPMNARLAEPMPLSVTVLRVGHGSHVLTPKVPSLPCHINYGVGQLVDLLSREHWVGGEYVKPTVLEANVLNMRYITGELLSEGIDPARFGLAALCLSGWYLPEAERATLARVWGAAVLDRYGVTEVNGDAKWCATCRAYHFDFTTVPEVLSVVTGDHVVNGLGRLVLTGLYPFNQAVPKLRYEIGDLVSVGPARCGTAEPAVSFVCRLRDAIWHPDDGHLVLAPTDVAESLAHHPDVARKPHTGFLKFATGGTGLAPWVRIELTYPPSQYSKRQAELRAEIETALCRRRPELLEVALDLEFCGPGELKEATKV
ncbi:MAG TPA: hypothetical protein VGS19_37405 [Streptosporangiaceae bacterium]|nr:hypothetical protein [Streptosporangiaceae bacterium]